VYLEPAEVDLTGGEELVAGYGGCGRRRRSGEEEGCVVVARRCWHRGTSSARASQQLVSALLTRWRRSPGQPGRGD
jgi:hypothetical protein